MQKLAAALVGLTLAACVPTGYVTYNGYQGAQRHWPLGEQSFGKTIDGVAFVERGLPARPYEIVGFVEIALGAAYMCPPAVHAASNAAAAAACWDYFALRKAKAHGADGIIVIDEHSGELVRALPTVKGATVTGAYEARERVTGVLIRFLQSPAPVM
jgi:hypothetical protein